ncbi:MAG: chitobiase/beta-hexosaminidase C-terminal domain-containing protein, partial [Geobacteraceae bacterium]|nr:chitobiase/beta-hexosaminidase C-terminal domain-containing protein [Geobacteraceae bacterium]
MRPIILFTLAVIVALTTASPVLASTITATAGAEGAITPAGSVAALDGIPASFTIKPAVGYRVDTPVGGSCGGSFSGNPYDTTNGIRYTTNTVSGDCTVAASFQRNIPSSSNLLAWYPFDNNVRDYSGNNLNGTPYNLTAANNRLGKSNAAYAFDSAVSPSYVDIANSPAFDISGKPFTFAAWIKMTGAFVGEGGFGSIFDRWDGANGYRLDYSPSTATIRLLGGTTPLVNDPANPVTMNNDTWYHIAAVADGAGNATIYINGAAVLSGPYVATNTDIAPRIGDVQNVSTEPFTGIIDDIRIYNRALSTTELNNIYWAEEVTLSVTKSGNGYGTVNASGCTLLWEGNNGSCIVAKDTGITLYGAAINGTTFTGWAGACTGTTPCTLSMDSDKMATASFSGIPATTVMPAGGTYLGSRDVSLSCSDISTCSIYYTTDGTIPTIDSTLYSTPFTVDSTTTVRFFARALSGASSPVKSETYTIVPRFDASFGVNGIANTSDSYFQAEAIQTDGKIAVAGHTSDGKLLLMRFSADGTPDSAFGTNGIVTDSTGSNSNASAVAIQTDGKIVITGQTYDGSNWVLFLQRFNANGSTDTNFGTLGRVTYNAGNDNSAGGMAIQNDGKIVITGYINNNVSSNLLLLRFMDNGTLDTGFGTAGVITYSSGFDSYGNGVILQPDGKIVSIGQTDNGSNTDLLALRFNTTGILDTGFGASGIFIYHSNMNNRGMGAAIQPDGKIVVVGTSADNVTSVNKVLTLRLNGNGTLDNSFGNSGTATYSIAGDDRGNGVAFQSNGKIVVVGISYNGSNDDLLLLRLNSNGSADTSFAPGGIFTYNTGSYNDYGYAVAIQADGRIVAAGYTEDTGTGLLLRLNSITPPTALTVAANDIKTAGATLNATVNANGLTATVTFEYGPTIAYGTSIAAIPTSVIGTTDTTFSAMISGLTPSTTYHYRVVATSSAGTANGSDVQFTTDPTPHYSTFDSAFGTAGVVSAPGNYFQAEAIQSDGKIVVAGYTIDSKLLLMRFTANGTPDTNFGTNGSATYSGGIDDSANDVAIQADGKIIVAGYTNNGARSSLLALRYLADGSPDTSFGSGGVVTYNVGDDDNVNAMAIRPDGRIVLTGSTFNGSDLDLFVQRLNSDGTPDISFGTSGTVTYNGGFDDNAHSVAIQADGKIVVAGETFNDSGIDKLLIARFNSNGALDSGFNGGGVFTYTSGISDIAQAIILQSDGRIVVAGSSYNGTFSSQLALRLDINGTLDNNFGTNGVTIYSTDNDIYANALTLQPDGRIILTGDRFNGTDYDLEIQRLNSNGTIDNSFAPGSIFTYDSGFGADHGYAVALQPDGRIVVAGYIEDTGTGLLLRLNGTTLPTAITGATSDITTSSATLNALANANGLSGTVSFEYGPTMTYGTIIAANPATISGTVDTTFSATINSLSPGATYHYRVVATNSAGSVAGNDVQFTTSKLSQSISFGSAPAVMTGGSGTVSASGGASGNPVIFTSQTPTVCTTTGTNGATITGVTVGTCIIAADQAGNTAYYAAQQITLSFTVTQGSANLNVTLTGSGSGTVYSNTGGIACITGSSADCSHSFANGTPVTLTAFPNTKSTFTGWGLPC